MTPVKVVRLVSLLALCLVSGCADSGGARHEEGDVPDAAGDVGGGDAQVSPRESVTGFGLSSGGGWVQSERFSAVVVVAGPSPAVQRESSRFEVRIGVGVPQVEPRLVSAGGER